MASKIKIDTLVNKADDSEIWVDKIANIDTVKADINLDNVDNTSDADKPISDDTQTALDAKLNTNATITHIEKDADLNDLTDRNTIYYNSSTGDVNSLVNKPSAVSWEITVRYIWDGAYWQQICFWGSSNKNMMYVRYKKGDDGWLDWTSDFNTAHMGPWSWLDADTVDWKWVNDNANSNSLWTSSKMYVDALQERFVRNSQFSMNWGWKVSYFDNKLKWDQRFIVISNWESNDTATSWHFDIKMPADDTTIHWIWSTDDVTVTDWKISIWSRDALFYKLPLWENNTSKDDNFYIGYYNKFDWNEIPKDYVLVANCSGDLASLSLWDWRMIKNNTSIYHDTWYIAPSLQNSWENYNTSDYWPTYYRRVWNTVYIEWLLKNWDVGSDKQSFTLPEWFRPNRRLLLHPQTNAGEWDDRLDIMRDWRVIMYNWSNNWFSVSCSFAVL